MKKSRNKNKRNMNYNKGEKKYSEHKISICYQKKKEPIK